jgi:hypothetical protein
MKSLFSYYFQELLSQFNLKSGRDKLRVFAKIYAFQNLCYLANLCNSMTVEMYGDKIRISHGFDGCQMLEYIADTPTAVLITRTDDITMFFGF